MRLRRRGSRGFFRGDLCIVVGVVVGALSLLVLVFVHASQSAAETTDVPWWRRPPPRGWFAAAPTLEQAARYADHIEWTLLPRNTRPEATPSPLPPAASTTRHHCHRYLHVISPYRERDPARRQHQELVMASLEVARAWMHRMHPDVHVTVLAVDDDEDESEGGSTRNDTWTPRRPASFATAFTPQLQQPQQQQRRRLPPLRAILAAALAHVGPAAAFTHVVYTNMDILVLPHFYAAVDAMVHCGFGTFFVNRVEIPERQLTAEQYNALPLHNPVGATTRVPRGTAALPLAAATDRPHTSLSLANAYRYALAFAQLHPGYDCVVATHEALARALPMLGDVFVGFPPVGGLLAEVLAHADPGCVTVRNTALTFHYGARNGGWGSSSSGSSSGSSSDAPDVAKVNVNSTVGTGRGGDAKARLVALNQRLAREARDAATAAVGGRYLPGARCRDLLQPPATCTAAHYYPPPGGAAAPKAVWA